VATKRSKASKQSKAQERQERLRELQKQQKRAERRRNMLIFGATAVVALAIIGGTAWGIMQQGDDANANSRLEPATDVGIDGVEFAEVTDSTHVAGDVDYPETPPVGGDHNEVWQNCGFYSEPVEDENAVHSLEHGAVWITFDEGLEDGQVDQLRQLATPGGYVLVTPHDDLPSDIVASAWGYQLQLDTADDPRLQEFLNTFVQGEQTLEPGAACTGGTGEPEFGE
jgi:Protein of unknown function (DUF3105)